MILSNILYKEEIIMSTSEIVQVHKALIKYVPGIWTIRRWYPLFAYIKKGVLYVPLKKKTRLKVGKKMGVKNVSSMDICEIVTNYNTYNEKKFIPSRPINSDYSIGNLQEIILTCSTGNAGLPDVITDDIITVFDAQCWIGNIIKHQPDEVPLHGIIENKWLKIPISRSACERYSKKYNDIKLSGNWAVYERSESVIIRKHSLSNIISEHFDNPVPSYQRYMDVETGKLFYFDNGNAYGLFIRGDKYFWDRTAAYNILTGESWHSFTKRNGLADNWYWLRVEVLTTVNENNINMKINELQKYLNRISKHISLS